VDRVCWRHPVAGANPGITVRCFRRKGNQLNLRGAERFPNLRRYLQRSRL
jgi:hypothetical protein